MELLPRRGGAHRDPALSVGRLTQGSSATEKVRSLFVKVKYQNICQEYLFFVNVKYQNICREDFSIFFQPGDKIRRRATHLTCHGPPWQ